MFFLESSRPFFSIGGHPYLGWRPSLVGHDQGISCEAPGGISTLALNLSILCFHFLSERTNSNASHVDFLSLQKLDPIHLGKSKDFGCQESNLRRLLQEGLLQGPTLLQDASLIGDWNRRTHSKR